MAVGDRSVERQTETDAGNGALESERAGESAPGSHAESAGLEHLSGGTGVKCPVFGFFRDENHPGCCQINSAIPLLHNVGRIGVTVAEKIGFGV